MLLSLGVLVFALSTFPAASDGHCVPSFSNTKLEIKKHRQRPSVEYVNGCMGKNMREHEMIIEVTCYRSKVEHLRPGAVQDLNNLNCLKFERNSMNNIEPGAFSSLNRLKKIRITDNKLEAIVKGVFNNLPLEEIDLSDNEISYIQHGAFSNMDNLSYVALAKNSLGRWENKWFKNSPTLTWLDLSHNSMQAIPAGAFKPFDKLKFIHLQGNKICRLHPNAFEGDYQLEELNLCENNIRTLHENTVPVRFSRRKIFNRLFLNDNQLMYLPKRFMRSLEAVNFLKIDGNPWRCPCREDILNFARECRVRIVKSNSSLPECASRGNRRRRKECVQEDDEELRRKYFENLDVSYNPSYCSNYENM